MKITRLFFALSSVIALNATGQTVSSNLDFVPGTSVSSATSGSFQFCDSSVHFTVSSTKNLTHYSPHGAIFPGALSNISTVVPISFSFTQPVCNLRIHFVDIDSLESLSSISTPYNGLTSSNGAYNPGGSTSVMSHNNDASVWLQWNGSLSSLTLNYNRPGSGYGLIIDSIIFECCQTCKCNYTVDFKSVGPVGNDGSTNASVALNSNGVAVRSISIDLTSYISAVDPACRLCDAGHQEAFGTVTSAPSLYGAAAELDDPYGLGVARKVTWNFSSPTVVNISVSLDLFFPPVLDLKCCENKVNYCMDVNFKNEDCTSCEYSICTGGVGSRTATTQVDKSSSVSDDAFSTDNRGNVDGFKLVPNPTDGKVSVSLSDDALIGGTISILTTSGSVVQTGIMTSNTETIDVSKLSSGSYIVSIRNNGKTNTQTLIIR